MVPPDVERVGRCGPGVVRASAVTRRVLGGNKKPRLLPSGSAAPGPRLLSRASRQIVARDLRPHPPHGGAASAYTSTRRVGRGSSLLDPRPAAGDPSTREPNRNLRV